MGGSVVSLKKYVPVVLFTGSDDPFFSSARNYLENIYGIYSDSAYCSPDIIADKTESVYDAIIFGYEKGGNYDPGFVKKIRQNGFFAPVILFSKSGGKDILNEAVKSGADFFIQGGCDEEGMYAQLYFSIKKSIEIETAKKEDSERFVFDESGDEVPVLKTVCKPELNRNNCLPESFTGMAEINEAEKSLKESEMLFTSVFKYVPIGMNLTNEEGRFISVNDEICRILGMSSEELIMKNFVDITHPDDMSADVELYNKLISGKINNYSLKKRYIHKDGSDVWVNISVFAIREGDKKPKYIVAMVENLTKQKIAEEKLFEREIKYSEIFNQSAQAIVIFDENGNIFESNDRIKQLFGTEYCDIINESGLFSDPNIPANIKMAIREGVALSSEIKYNFDLLKEVWGFTSEKKGTIDLDVRLIPISRNGKIICFILIINDISDIKNSQDALFRANNKLKILSGITRHDILNQITAIKLYNELILEQIKDNSKACQVLNKIDKCTDMIRAQINFTKNYENLGLESPSWQDLNNCVRQASLGVLAEGITFRNCCDDYLVFADPMLLLVFSNLFDNSIRHGVDINSIGVSFKESGDNGLIIFEDDGAGISDCIKEKIFLKGFGSNTGYGLFLIREILAINGFLIVETGTKGVGARFEITVPPGKWRLNKK
ncbi:PAS domain S-box protein [Methanoplanus sp. FWC-SCC4]|uniref:histidine kinase n=1 Tax=Methanochimaera problematica TaxID=2609417 RepID=A0AA97FE94_9EURY|nr:PAS domain S-box protein [Methanoplanus sp. FWC-SCC4]WOF16668.1 PAS domain S-box protein [Methanoplanus sp. FWC-SCC4]